MKYILGILLITLSIFAFESCDSSNKSETMTTQKVTEIKLEDMKKIDAHTHYRYDRSYLKGILDSMNMQTLIIDVVKNNRGKISRFWDEYKGMDEKYPGKFFLCTGFNGMGIDEDNYVERVLGQVKSELSQGARMVKVWKNFGMVTTDDAGNHIQIDDPRLQPIFDYLTEQNVPVMAHIAEPIQAWLPIDTMNPHSGYFSSHPQYHAYLNKEIPRYETIISARDNWLEKNPKMTVLAAHMGSMAHDVDEVAKRLEKYPNMYVEPGARFGDLVRQDSDKVRAFFIKYQDRILYGSDLGTWGDASGQSEEAQERWRKHMLQMYAMQWKYLTTGGAFDYDSPNLPNVYPTKGLELPREVLEKIYYKNAAKLLKVES